VKKLQTTIEESVPLTPKKERSSTSVKRKTPWIITGIMLIAAVGGYFSIIPGLQQPLHR
jgi:hypothetical protein